MDYSSEDKENDYFAQENFPADISPRLALLFTRIQYRGTQPLFPASWKIDFLGLPSTLFVQSNSNFRPPICSMNNTDSGEFRGKLAFKRLVFLGRDIRDRIQLNKEYRLPHDSLAIEPYILSELKRFQQWMEKDSVGLFNLEKTKIPYLIYVSSCYSDFSKNVNMNINNDYMIVAEKMENKLREAAQYHRQRILSKYADRYSIYNPPTPPHEEYENTQVVTIDKFPTIYGFAICRSQVAIVSLNSSDLKNPIRTLLVIDYCNVTQDLWSAIAIALTMVASRDETIEWSYFGGTNEISNLTKQMANVKMTEDVDF
ncbi:hypothetical protein PNEG_00304 [Pneumocystis murina B123]|uniref:Uncharacterized protein n=1 Tax=Pneumocystis murina (strain B123) TaxID=1069680 RepID=M7PLG0_PNEMU|nr:hypothetical protein PNEG_00304 [Pneumocystis murina B123]EMR11274.1 hypothetical protein PNEG_00304 [Pneumocystis murina B123]